MDSIETRNLLMRASQILLLSVLVSGCRPDVHALHFECKEVKRDIYLLDHDIGSETDVLRDGRIVQRFDIFETDGRSFSIQLQRKTCGCIAVDINGAPADIDRLLTVPAGKPAIVSLGIAVPQPGAFVTRAISVLLGVDKPGSVTQELTITAHSIQSLQLTPTVCFIPTPSDKDSASTVPMRLYYRQRLSESGGAPSPACH